MLHSVVIKKCCHQTDIRNDKSKKTSNQYRSKIAGKQYEGQWLSSSDNICINITRNTPDMENVIDCLKICPFFALELLLIKKRLITLGNKSLI